ncbi:Molybdenum cofactor synthesis protein 1 [Quaeritorhiza haematococci]|nr:Molybdenum cofactor synthesis protein 1 [Quaeritorhiza haematococci]
MPAEGVPLTPKENLLTTEEIIRVARVFVQEGVTKIRLTGGEPTVRKDIVDIVAGLNDLRSLGLKKIGMTTNGLALKRKLIPLRKAGLDHLNVSLDTLDRFKFELMTRRKGLEAVLESLDQALEAGFEQVKLNSVVIRNVNDDELADFVGLTKERDLYVRFIEYMPFDGNKWNKDKFVPYKEMLEKISHVHPNFVKVADEKNDTSKAYKIDKSSIGKFGFITSMSDHFCGTCNRLRITADGHMKVCLFGNAEVDLLKAMRGGIGDDELVGIIGDAGKEEGCCGSEGDLVGLCLEMFPR